MDHGVRGRRLERPVLIVSPHLDDAVLSCGRLIAEHPGTVVVTVFGGWPSAQAGVTTWDSDCGFRPGDDPIAARRAEDEQALALLDASARWLDFVDSQYTQAATDVDAIAAALDAALAAAAPRTVIGPLGISHPDHRTSAAAVMALKLQSRTIDWLVYQEALYRLAPAAEQRQALATLTGEGLSLDPVVPALDPGPERKRAAIACYRSQVRGLLRRRVPALVEATTPERYWRIESPPKGCSQT
jgi:LmbE family N-acetylglucosaminyl deacetylase